jgi:hypothetical protein
MILGFNKHAWGKHNFFIHLGGVIVRFISENLGKTKGFKKKLIPFLMGIRSG